MTTIDAPSHCSMKKSRIEHCNVEKFGVEAYVLKKITNHLPLHRLCSNRTIYRSKAGRLWLQNFSSHWSAAGGWSIHQHTLWWPAGWTLSPTIGKIQGRDVVDVANMTLEQDVLKELTGSRCSYVAVLSDYKNRYLRYLQRRNGQVVEGQQPHTLRRESDHVDCWIWQMGFGRSRISQGAKNDELKPGKEWRCTWQTKGFWPVGCWRQIATNRTSIVLWILIIICPVNIVNKLYIFCTKCA